MKPQRGNFETSIRQQACYKVLKRGWNSSMEITNACGIVNPSGAVSALRLNGIPIEKKKFVGLNGKLITRWRIK